MTTNLTRGVYFLSLSRIFATAWIVLLSVGIVNAQNGEVKGQVFNENLEPLIGVSVGLKGTLTGALTDVEGKFSLPMNAQEGVLEVSYVGFIAQEIKAEGGDYITVTLIEDNQQLSEVVVTALGLKRQKRSLGYASQEVGGEDLDKAREPNVVNALTGKVAGVNITQGASGPTSTARIVIRGESSLTGNNQPLFVVDGIPINNQTFGAAGNNRTMGADFGNGAIDINPDDVESINILKGPNASALYGSRAANGVVLITTKSGKGRKGLGISVNSTATFERPLRLWRYQNDYGVGSNFEFAYVNGLGGGVNDFIDESWGPRLDGRLVAQHDSPTTGGMRAGDIFNPDRGDIIPSPFLAQPNGIRNFYETGVTFTNNVSISGGNDKGHFRFSYTNLDNKGILPNTGLQRNTFSLASGYKASQKLTFDVVANYVNSGSDNVKNHGYGTESVEYTWIWWGRNINLDNLKDYWQEGFEGLQQFNFNYNWNDNPYFTLYENTNSFNKGRIFGNMKANYAFTPKLNLMLRAGTDYSNDQRASRRAFSSQRFPFGMYREDRFLFNENNYDFLLTYTENTRQMNGFAWSASLGANRMDQRVERLLVSANQLNVPGVYSLNNTRIPLEFDQFNSSRRINSVYGFTQLSYRNYLFLDVTARNDWSSTLPLDNNSYFYPSVTMSAVFSEMFDLGDKLSFGKFRMGYAQVGNDTDPFRLRNFYNSTGNWGAIQTAGEQATLANSNLKPEIAGSFEVGMDLRFFKDRLALDVTYYNNNSRNQIINVPVSRASGYTARFLNAGLVNSYGLEAMITAYPIRKKDFSWIVNMNWSFDRTYIRELAEGLEVFQLASEFTSVQARVGERMGDMYGLGILRAEDGRPIYNQSGFPIRRNNLELLGNYNPDWMAGIYNTFKYKNFILGFLVDMKYGGVVYSRTYLIAHTSGVHANTANREGEFVGDGWVRLADGSLAENTTPLTGRDFYWSHFNRDNHAEGTFDATFVKLRELRVGYSIPASAFGRKMPFRSMNISVVGRNLLLWAKEVKDFDPDVFSLSGNNIVPGIENTATPSLRSIGLNLNFEL